MTENLLRATVTQRGVCFAPDGPVLLLQRASDGRWELPGGRVGTSESTMAGLRRKIVEETGLTPQVITPLHTLTWQNDEDEGRFIVYYYFRLSNQSVMLSPEYTDSSWEKHWEVETQLSDSHMTAVEKAVGVHQQK